MTRYQPGTPTESERSTGRWVAYAAAGLFTSIMLLHAIAGYAAPS